MEEYIERAKLLGHNVVWTVKETLLPYDVVAKVIEMHGLSANALSEPNPKKALMRACKSTAKNENGRFEDNYVRKICDNKYKYSIAILHENRDAESDTVSGEQTTTVKFYKESGKVEADGEKADAFMEHYNAHKSGVTDDDIRSFIVQTVRDKGMGISLRPTGGIYFVPINNQEVVENLNKVLETLGVGEMLSFKMLEGEGESKGLKEAFGDELRKQLDFITGNVESMTKRVKNLHDKRDKVKELNEIVEVYKNLLNWETEAEEAYQAIRDADEMIAKKISELS